MRRTGGFLLLELLIASIIICTTGFIISRTFSREIDLTGVTSDYNAAINLIRQKLFDEELKIKQIKTKEEVKKYKSSGTFDNYLKFLWESELTPFEAFEDMYVLKVKVKGIKGDRELLLSKWIFFKIPEEEDEEKNGDSATEENAPFENQEQDNYEEN